MVRLAAYRPDHAGSSGAAILPAVRSLPLPPAAPHQGHLAALRLRGPSQRRAAAAELRLLTGPADGKPRTHPLLPRRLSELCTEALHGYL